MENFVEYMWYLLTTPFKKVRKSVNAWYIWCKVVGKYFDSCKEAILTARDEGMVATSSELMLPLHGADRGMVRYVGEHVENFRSRIAMYEEMCKFGGTNQGIILAVKTLGYANVTLTTAKELTGDTERWAEFYVLIRMDMEQTYPISYDILKKNVRIWKEVGAKDNYQFIFRSTALTNQEYNRCRAVIKMPCILEEKNMCKIIFRAAAENELKSKFIINIKNDLWKLDGTYKLDGTRKLDAYEKTEELL